LAKPDYVSVQLLPDVEESLMGIFAEFQIENGVANGNATIADIKRPVRR